MELPLEPLWARLLVQYFNVDTVLEVTAVVFLVCYVPVRHCEETEHNRFVKLCDPSAPTRRFCLSDLSSIQIQFAFRD